MWWRRHIPFSLNGSLCKSTVNGNETEFYVFYIVFIFHNETYVNFYDNVIS